MGTGICRCIHMAGEVIHDLYLVKNSLKFLHYFFATSIIIIYFAIQSTFKMIKYLKDIQELKTDNA